MNKTVKQMDSHPRVIILLIFLFTYIFQAVPIVTLKVLITPFIVSWQILKRDNKKALELLRKYGA
jgi:hypothetical protein